MKKVLCWVGILLLSLSFSVGLTRSVQSQAQSQAPWLLFLYCQPEGGYFQMNIVPEGASGLTWRGHGALNNTVINVSGRSSYRLEGESVLSMPSDPFPNAPITATLRSLEAASRGQSEVIGQAALKDIRVYPQEEIGLSGNSTVQLLVDAPAAYPQFPFSNSITNCRVANLTALRSRLVAPSQATFACTCSNPNLPPEMGAEPSSSPTFTEWRDRTGEACRISARVEGTFGCNR